MSPYLFGLAALAIVGAFVYIKKMVDVANGNNEYETDGDERTKIRHEGGI